MRFATHDGPGIRTTVFLKGCPLACSWCHNPESQDYRPEVLFFEERCQHCGECVAVCRRNGSCLRCGRCVEACVAEARQMAGRVYTVGELLQEVERDLVFYSQSHGGVTLSGGEPLSRPRFVAAFLRACRERGIATALETCGFARLDVFLETAPLAGLVLFDLKVMDADAHKTYTGVRNAAILKNLEALVRLRHPMRVRIPVVPGVNDSAEEMRAFAEFLGPLGPKVELLPYHAIGAGKYSRLRRKYSLQQTPEPGPALLARFRDELKRAGLQVELGGTS